MRPSGGVVVRRVVAGMTLATLALAGRSAAAPPDTDATASPDEPAIEVVDSSVIGDTLVPGQTFKVEGTGWPANVLVQLEVCGAEARSGSSDCAVDTAQVVASGDDGTLRGRVPVVVPPSPCPCVIRALSQTGTATATAPVEVPGAPSSHPGDGTVVAPALRRLEVEKVTLRGDDTWRTWLGVGPQRTFEFEVVNTGSVPVSEATVILSAGPIDDPDGFVPPVRLDRLEVGERRSVTVPIQFPALTWGEQQVRAVINGTSAPVAFSATTTSYPWLLIIVPAVLLLQLLLVTIRNRVRRRLHDLDDVPEAPDPTLPADDALICVVEYALTIPSPDGVAPTVEHRTEVVRSTAVVRQLVLDSLRLDEAVEEIDEAEAVDEAIDEAEAEVVDAAIDEVDEPVDEPVTATVTRIAPPAAPAIVISSITLLADADAKVGVSYHACDVLCDWIETTYAESPHPAAKALTLRRHISPGGNASAAAASGMGMVPLSVMVRAPHVRAVA